jgi:hypothetical protein
MQLLQLQRLRVLTMHLRLGCSCRNRRGCACAAWQSRLLLSLPLLVHVLTKQRWPGLSVGSLMLPSCPVQ